VEKTGGRLEDKPLISSILTKVVCSSVCNARSNVSGVTPVACCVSVASVSVLAVPAWGWVCDILDAVYRLEWTYGRGRSGNGIGNGGSTEADVKKVCFS
jgi:hypothetical protein